MAGNRKQQSAAAHFSTVLKVVLLCTLIGGSAIGYVWQKSEISRLDKAIRAAEKNLSQMQNDNRALTLQIEVLKSPVMIDRRVKELNLGLQPAQPAQKVILAESQISASSAKIFQPRQLAQRPAVDLNQ
jgi:cell division protein FtsB